MTQAQPRPSIDPRWLIGILVAVIPISVGWISAGVRESASMRSQIEEQTRRIETLERNAISKDEYAYRAKVVDEKLNSIDLKVSQIVDHLVSLPTRR